MTIWTNAELTPSAMAKLVMGTDGHQLLIDKPTSNLSSGGASEMLSRAEVAFGQPDPGQLVSLTDLKWVHITSAGYTRYDSPAVRSYLASLSVPFTNSSSVFDEPCAQHLLAFILAGSRQIPASYAAQLGDRSWVYSALRPQTTLLKGQRVLIVGFGAIGRRLAQMLAPFGVEVVGLRRSPSEADLVKTYSLDSVMDWLPWADQVVNILPGHATTDRFFDARLFGAMRPGAVFHNMGRGTTVDQSALVACLESGQVGGAFLDVTDPEPLPPSDPLWSAPNCLITPHIGGGFSGEHDALVDHFLANLRRFESGEPLVDVVF